MRTSKKLHIWQVLLVAAAVATLPWFAAGLSAQKILLDTTGVRPGWQVVSEDQRTDAVVAAEGVWLKNFNETNFVYTDRFGYRDYDRLRLVLKTDEEIRLTIIPDITTTANYTFENQITIPASESVEAVQLSLHYPNFKSVENFGIKFFSARPANILIQEISLSRAAFWGRMAQAAADYFRVAPYSPFTVNVMATPRIFGHSAFLYFLPGFLILTAAALFSRRFGRRALAALLMLWFVTDARMNYEFLRYMTHDYQTWVKPAAPQKTLRTYGNFYSFLDWLRVHRPADASSLIFYSSDNLHYPRIAAYYLYPVRVQNQQGGGPGVYVVYQDRAISYNEQDKRLYRLEQPFTGPGEVTIVFDENSFIFVSR
ncbi:MAG: hypothetical protein A2846_04870 [Candidatus Doudnabacteria bacterium RIFCSPHIGHO2_01_FULL_49_9]|uniref:Uncharacterized protein n=1 Tax=Candidatus Doudnabacteria bacterium RIFCSPHIGHO2_01_FULL_49_9 TaxID=1817827 RepID=A0A1F5P3V2_9BACT|nr:MAG: hypothetical protein A2846_04870 [Candidatus Doudnabacteria bacterium RIFCSPHIGHO2_01_FULL_49_9]